MANDKIVHLFELQQNLKVKAFCGIQNPTNGTTIFSQANCPECLAARHEKVKAQIMERTNCQRCGE